MTEEIEATQVTGEAQVEQTARIGELEGSLAELQAAIATRESEATSLKEQLAAAATRYRALVLAGAPEVPEELVTGATVDEIDTSLAAARSMVEKVRRQLESQAKAERVPAGAPARTPPDLSGLSPGEKIAYALARYHS